MSVLLQTTLGAIVIDLNLESCPIFSRSFLSLCSMNYYSKHLIFNVLQNRFFQTGDPTGTGTGGSSIFGVLSGEGSRFIKDEYTPLTPSQRKIKGLCIATKIGSLGMTHGSQFTVTTSPGDGHGIHEYGGFEECCVFGQVVEDGEDVLGRVNGIYTDKGGRPYTDVRVEWCEVLDWGGLEKVEGTEGRRVERGGMERPEEEELEIRIRAGEELEGEGGGRERRRGRRS